LFKYSLFIVRNCCILTSLTTAVQPNLAVIQEYWLSEAEGKDEEERCLGAAAPVTGAAADEYDINQSIK